MKFHVGPNIYTVVITRELPPGVVGFAEYLTRRLLINVEVPLEHRLDVLLHELQEAYLLHFPRPKGKEEVCDLFATVARTMMKDLEAGGGEKALRAMVPPGEEPAPPPVELVYGEPEMYESNIHSYPAAPDRRFEPLRTVAACDSRAVSSGGRAQCGVCHRVYADGAIVTDPPRWEDKHAGKVTRRRMYCDFCNHIAEWIEGWVGGPNGAVVEGPRYVEGFEVIEFLRKFPQAAGIAE